MPFTNTIQGDGACTPPAWRSFSQGALLALADRCPSQVSSARAEVWADVFGGSDMVQSKVMNEGSSCRHAGFTIPRAARQDFEQFMHSMGLLLGGESSSEEVAANAALTWRVLQGCSSLQQAQHGGGSMQDSNARYGPVLVLLSLVYCALHMGGFTFF